MALKDTSNLGFELSDLNYLCCHASPASNYLILTWVWETEENYYHPLTCVASLASKNKKGRETSPF